MNRRFPFTKLNWLLAGAAAIAILSFAVSILLADSSSNIVWLSASEAARITAEPERLTILERLMDRIPPLRRWRNRPRPYTVSLETIVLTVPRTAWQEIGLGEPAATNSDGVRLWIISARNAPRFYTKFLRVSQTNSGYQYLNRDHYTMADSVWAFCTSRPYGYTISASERARLLYQWQHPLDDIEIETTALNLSNCFKLTAAMRMVPPTTNTPAPFGFCLRVPDAGILVVDCGKFKNHFGKPYWFLLAPSDPRADRPVFPEGSD